MPKPNLLEDGWNTTMTGKLEFSFNSRKLDYSTLDQKMITIGAEKATIFALGILR